MRHYLHTSSVVHFAHVISQVISSFQYVIVSLCLDVRSYISHIDAGLQLCILMPHYTFIYVIRHVRHHCNASPVILASTSSLMHAIIYQ